LFTLAVILHDQPKLPVELKNRHHKLQVNDTIYILFKMPMLQRVCTTIALLLGPGLFSQPALADSLENLPSRWQGRLEAVVHVDLSPLEPNE